MILTLKFAFYKHSAVLTKNAYLATFLILTNLLEHIRIFIVAHKVKWIYIHTAEREFLDIEQRPVKFSDKPADLKGWSTYHTSDFWKWYTCCQSSEFHQNTGDTLRLSFLKPRGRHMSISAPITFKKTLLSMDREKWELMTMPEQKKPKTTTTTTTTNTKKQADEKNSTQSNILF